MLSFQSLLVTPAVMVFRTTLLFLHTVVPRGIVAFESKLESPYSLFSHCGVGTRCLMM